jgi:hypothetical protein
MREDMRDESLTTDSLTSGVEPAPYFTPREWVALLLLRRRYHAGQDNWTARELEHLRFYRWLHERACIES